MPDDKYQVEIRSYQSANIPLIGRAVHNEVVFSVNGQPLFAFNGDAYNRRSGELTNFSTSGEDTLRVRVLEGVALQDIAPDYPLVSQTVAANLSKEDFVRGLAQAVEASEFINSQNLNYIIVGAPILRGHHFEAQNSNSAANTIMTAMGIPMPVEVRSQWAPGQDRLLLPEGWKPRTDSMTHEERVAFLKERLGKLEENTVGAQVRNDPNPNTPELHKPQDFVRPPSQIFFDPKPTSAF
jgi:hypothetical protein